MLLAQISDTHVTPAGRGTGYSGDTGPALARCVNAIMTGAPAPDAVIATGDLANAGSADEYERLRELLAPLAIPVYLMPGNHDRRSTLRRAFPDHAYLPATGSLHYVVDRYDVRLVMLDTVIEGEDGGTLDAAQLSWLDAALAAPPRKPTLIFMHHPPVCTGIHRMDSIRLEPGSAARLGEIVARSDRVERIACGHVHRTTHARWQGTVVSICPSTAFQAQADLRAEGEFSATQEPPAYQTHYWNGAQLVTHTISLPAAMETERNS